MTDQEIVRAAQLSQKQKTLLSIELIMPQNRLSLSTGLITEMNVMVTMHIGFDDTDSPRMGCTTYIAALLVKELRGLGASFVDYPNLVRLNPNVPWKTRGNGALCLRIKCNPKIFDEVMDAVTNAIEENADLNYEGTDPGVVFFFGRIPRELKDFAKRTIRGVVKKKEAMALIKKFEAEALDFKKGRGVIGGLAAIGETLDGDHTYEVIAYRRKENCGTPRRLVASSVIEMDAKTKPLTFNNVDPERKRILITPRGPDPILYGVRGETPSAVKQAHEMIKPTEKVERWVIFRTNHGTDSHLERVDAINEIRPFASVVVRGTVTEDARIIRGGHVIFPIKDDGGKVDCAAYKPTGALKDAAKKLISGDFVEACGGVVPRSCRHPTTINLEKMRVIKLAPKVLYTNPVCPRCGKRMKSMGKEQGHRCKRCGSRTRKLWKTAVEKERDVKTGLHITTSRSQRHLTKPFCRYGREKKGTPKAMIREWHFP